MKWRNPRVYLPKAKQPVYMKSKCGNITKGFFSESWNMLRMKDGKQVGYFVYAENDLVGCFKTLDKIDGWLPISEMEAENQ